MPLPPFVSLLLADFFSLQYCLRERGEGLCALCSEERLSNAHSFGTYRCNFFLYRSIHGHKNGRSIYRSHICLLTRTSFYNSFPAKLFKERLTKRQFFGVGIAAMGTFIVIMGGSINLQTNQQFLLGSLILLSTPILWTAYTLLGKSIMEKYSPFLVVAYVNIFGGLFLIPFSLIKGFLTKFLPRALMVG
ncbi:MAG: hypothetical protein QME50_07410 [Candidatus Bathyarchaeota archaeon]|nr:hypothetical protein [Candidatus Bathyarchaeota archaeon]